MKKIVIIGASGHMNYALEGVEQKEILTNGVKIVAIAPGSKEELAHVKSRHANIQEGKAFALYENYLTMLDAERPDVAVINPWFSLHAEITKECLSRNIHCFVEKPIALNPTDLSEIKELHKKSGVKLTAMLEYRYWPEFYAVWKAIEDGLIGKPLQIQAQKSYKNGPKPEWQQSRKTFGGTIPWVGTHALDWILWMSKSDVEVLAATQTKEANRNNNEMESAASILFRLKNGGQATANIDYLRPKSAPSHGDDRVRIAGEIGVVEASHGKAILIDENGGERELPLEPKKFIFTEFLNHIDGAPFRISEEDVWRVTALSIASQESADSQ